MSNPIAKSAASLVDEAWDRVVGSFHWLKSVLLGEFEDNRSLSAIIADMLISFVPAVVIVTSSRDAIAVILRMAKYPEKREDLMEWVLLCACLITIALPLTMAAAGVAAAGVGAVVGGIAGSELGAALRAVMLLLIKASTKLMEVVQFLRKFMKGDILKFLRAIKFAQYDKALVSALRQFVGKLLEITQGLIKYLDSLPSIQHTRQLIAKLKDWEKRFYGVQQSAIKNIPLALAELDARLAKVLTEVLPREVHTVPAGVKAEKPLVVTPPKQEVRDVPGRVFKEADTAKPHPPAKLITAKPVTPPPEKPPRKDRPEEPEPAEDKSNTKKQEVADARVESETKATPATLATNPRNIREAAQTWPPEKKARFDLADKYYRDAGYKDYDSHLRGINFDKPVEIISLSKGETIYQYSYLDRMTGQPKVGSYFYRTPDVDPGKLGFDVNGRRMIQTELSSPGTFLKSTASNIEDWNGSDKIFEGGSVQLFNPNANLIKAAIIK